MIDRILRSLGVLRDLERDGMERVSTQVVAHQLDDIRSERAVAKLPAALLRRGGEQARDRNALADSSWHNALV